MVMALVFMAATILPSISWAGHGLKIVWVTFALWLIALFIEQKRSHPNLMVAIHQRMFELGMFACWCTVVILNTALGRGYVGEYHLLLMGTQAAFIIVELYYSSATDGRYKILILALIITIGIEVVRSLPFLLSSTSISRQIATGLMENEQVSALAAFGIGSYSLYTGLGITSVVQFGLALSQRGWLRYLLLASAIGCAVGVILSMFLAASLIMLMGWLLLMGVYVWQHPSRLRAMLTILLVASLLCITWSTQIVKTEQGMYLQEKYFEIIHHGTVSTSTAISNNDFDTRTEVYSISLNTIASFPVFGVGPSTGSRNPNYLKYVGGHSSWLDFLAEYGFFGFGFYLIYFAAVCYRVVRFSLRTNADPLFSAGRIIACLLFLFFGFINPIINQPVIIGLFYFSVVMGTGYIPVHLRNRLGIPHPGHQVNTTSVLQSVDRQPSRGSG